jgi:hypothetical protein
VEYTLLAKAFNATVLIHLRLAGPEDFIYRKGGKGAAIKKDPARRSDSGG